MLVRICLITVEMREGAGFLSKRDGRQTLIFGEQKNYPIRLASYLFG